MERDVFDDDDDGDDARLSSGGSLRALPVSSNTEEHEGQRAAASVLSMLLECTMCVDV